MASSREIASLRRALAWGNEESDELVDEFLDHKIWTYVETLGDLFREHGADVSDDDIELSDEILVALKRESIEHAGFVVDTYNRDMNAFVDRVQAEPKSRIEDWYEAWANDRAEARAEILAITEAYGAHADATIAFYAAQEGEHAFDFGDHPEDDAPSCEVCAALVATNPHPLARVLEVGSPHIGCFVPETEVSGLAEALWSRSYDGEVVRVHTSARQQFTATPNHPCLTQRGWVPAGLLTQSDHLIRVSGGQQVVAAAVNHPHEHGAPAAIGEYARTPDVLGLLRPSRVPSRAEDFHGDGRHGEVDVVRADGSLRDGLQAASEQQIAKLVLPSPDLAEGARAGRGLSGALVARRRAAAHSGVCALHAGVTAAQLHALRAKSSGDGADGAAEPRRDRLGAQTGTVERDDRRRVDVVSRRPTGAAGRYIDAGGAHGPAQATSVDAQAPAQVAQALPGLVSSDRVVKVERLTYAGLVHTLTSPLGWFFASHDYIVANCRQQWRRTGDELGDELRMPERTAGIVGSTPLVNRHDNDHAAAAAAVAALADPA